MPPKILKRNVNLAICPKEIISLDQNELSIGDLHANPLLLLNILVENGVVTIAEGEYDEFARIYAKLSKNRLSLGSSSDSDSDEEKNEEINLGGTIDDLLKKLENLKFAENAGQLTVRLMGDILADRGYDDELMMKWLTLLSKNTKLKILWSNHDLEFLRWYQRGFDQKAITMPEFSRSLVNFSKRVKQNPELETVVKNFVEEVYKPNLAAIDYTISKEADGKDSIILHTHAPVPFSVFKEIANYYSLDYNDETVVELGKTIDRINKKLNELLSGPEFFNQIFSDDVVNQVGAEHPSFKNVPPFTKLFWLRHAQLYQSGKIPRPVSHNGYNIYYCHGHDSISEDLEWQVSDQRNAEKNHVFDLNQRIGKKDEETNAGELRVLSSNSSPTLQKAPLTKEDKNFYTEITKRLRNEIWETKFFPLVGSKKTQNTITTDIRDKNKTIQQKTQHKTHTGKRVFDTISNRGRVDDKLMRSANIFAESAKKHRPWARSLHAQTFYETWSDPVATFHAMNAFEEMFKKIDIRSSGKFSRDEMPIFVIYQEAKAYRMTWPAALRRVEKICATGKSEGCFFDTTKKNRMYDNCIEIIEKEFHQKVSLHRAKTLSSLQTHLDQVETSYTTIRKSCSDLITAKVTAINNCFENLTQLGTETDKSRTAEELAAVINEQHSKIDNQVQNLIRELSDQAKKIPYGFRNGSRLYKAIMETIGELSGIAPVKAQSMKETRKQVENYIEENKILSRMP